MDRKHYINHAESSEKGIESKLDLCKVPEHEKREIMQMVYAYANYMLAASDAD